MPITHQNAPNGYAPAINAVEVQMNGAHNGNMML